MVRRVQVERLRTPASINPVASPVDVFVRPAEREEPKSEVLTAVKALAPAVESEFEKQQRAEAEAQAEADRQARKRQAEIERKQAQRKAFEAKLSFEQAKADWKEKLNANAADWYEKGEDFVGQQLQNHFLGVMEGVEDEEIRTAIDQDYQLFGVETLSDYEENRVEHFQKTRTAAAFTNLIESDMTGEEFVKKVDEDIVLLNQTYDIPFKALNDYLADIALQRVEIGDDRFYTALKELKQDSVGDPNRQQVVSQIEGVLKRRQTEQTRLQQKAQEEAIKQVNEQRESDFGESLLDSVVENGGIDILGNPAFAGWTDAEGNLNTLTFSQKRNLVLKVAEQRDNADQALVVQGQLDPQEALQRSFLRWESLGIKNPKWEAEMQGGLLTASNIAVQELPMNDDEFMAALPDSFQKGLNRYKMLKASNPTLLAKNTDNQTRVMYDSIEILASAYGEPEAIRRVIDLASDGGRVSTEDKQLRYSTVAEKINSLELDNPDEFFDQAPQNRGYITKKVDRLVKAYISLNVPADAALDQAVEVVKDSHQVIRGIAIPRVDGMPQNMEAIAEYAVEQAIADNPNLEQYDPDELAIAPVGNSADKWRFVLREDAFPVSSPSIDFQVLLDSYNRDNLDTARAAANESITERNQERERGDTSDIAVDEAGTTPFNIRFP